ncbi:MAG: SusD/RagB family nutrient-binding outer membrane lipoprotein [Cyclobacteriaceae bacterium]|nr:SusD/RagB family nutrient-binding outer membrane lipoprotein [Cyclobacteriaceae bacterium]
MRILYKLTILFLIVLMPMASCDTERLHGYNIDPQAVTEVNSNFLFTAALLSTASGGASGDNRYIDWRTNIGMCAYAIQQLANAGGGIAPGDKYTMNFETNAAPFEFMYGDVLKNVAEIMRITGPGGFEEGRRQNMRNVSRIIRAFSFHRLVDYYGHVPYFEANTGTLPGGTFFPKYDDGKVVYTEILQELEDAINSLNPGLPDEGFSNADLYYNGDITKWRKFGYSLMLRMAMRASKADQALANTYVTKAVAGGVFTSNADNAYVEKAENPGLWVNQNGISRAFWPGDGGQPAFLSKTLIDWLKGTDPNDISDDDPRLMILSGGIFAWSPTNIIMFDNNPLNQKGMPNGKDQAMLDDIEGRQVIMVEEYSQINPKLLDRDEPYMIMNYGEIALLLADALVRGIGTGIQGTAQQHYEAGVRASMQMYTLYDPSFVVTDAQVNAYLANYPYNVYKPALEMIGEQLWVNKFLNWWEAWADWRRTGYPTLTPTNYPGNETNGQIPRRLMYPLNEVGGNPNFTNGSLNPDLFTTRVWWDAP